MLLVMFIIMNSFYVLCINPQTVILTLKDGRREEVAVALVLPWAKTSFTEPLPAEEVERHIRGIYNRYGMPSPFRWRFGRSHPLRLEVQL